MPHTTQTERLRDDQDDASAYWRQTLADAPPLLDLPADERDTTASGLGRVRLPLAAGLAEALTAIATSESCDWAALFASASAATLSFLSGQEEVVLGMPLAQRAPESAPASAGRLDIVPLRLGIGGRPSLRQLLRQAQGRLSEVREQVLPLEDLIAAANPPRLPGRHPFYQVVIYVERSLSPLAATSDRFWEAVAPLLASAELDLVIALEQSPDGILSLRVDHNQSRYNSSFAERLAQRIQLLLLQGLAEPDRPLHAGLLLNDSERERLLGTLSHGEESGCSETVAELFSIQAQTQPTAEAARLGSLTLSYAELDRRSNIFAANLRQSGVAERALVGISLPRSFELLVALLGIVKAGCAYLPLDPDYPSERLETMLEISQVKQVVADRKSAAGMPASAALHFLDPEKLEQGPDQAAPAVSTRPDDLLYVMFTSGSTGEPKGATIPQQGIVRLAKGRSFYKIDSTQVGLYMAPLSFDASALEVWASLLNGASLVIMPPGRQSLEDIGSLIREQGVTVAFMTSALFQMMVDYRLDDLRGLEQLLTGGDVVSPEHIAQAQRELPQLNLVCCYGPTEVSVISSCYPVPRSLPTESPLPIGYPFNETTVYVLDETLALIPPEAPGELYLGGPAVAQGYVNRPELTAERFLDNPYRPGETLYRSGDLVRRRHSDGRLSFLGRRDNQVKVRGFRIELADVEAKLRDLDGVAGAVAAARGEGVTKELVAYLVLSSKLSLQEISSALRERLPDYLIPTSFFVVDDIPLNPAGKIDRRRLDALGRRL